MKKNVFIVVLLLVVSILSVGAVFATDNTSFSEQELYDAQKNVLEQIALEDEKYESGFYSTEDGLYVIEERKVIFDYTNDLKVIEQSMTKPIAVRKVSTTMSLIPLENSDRLASMSLLSYTNCITIDSIEFTHDENATFFEAEMKYRYIQDWYVDYQYFDAYLLQEINFSFDSNGYGYIINFYGEHHQKSCELDNNYQVVFDGSVYSSDCTDKNFSMYVSSGSTSWNPSNSEYCLIISTGTGGLIGSNYEVSQM